MDQTENGQNASWCSGARTRAAAGSLCTIDISPKLYSIDTKLSCQEDRIWAWKCTNCTEIIMFGFTTAAIIYLFSSPFSFEQRRPRTFKKCLGGTESREESNQRWVCLEIQCTLVIVNAWIVNNLSLVNIFGETGRFFILGRSPRYNVTTE